MSWPVEKPVSPGPDYVWGWTGTEYNWINSSNPAFAFLLLCGGGRYKQSIVVIGHGKVYYGNIT